MSKALLKSLALVLTTAALLCAVSCGSPRRQPVNPVTVDAPRGPVTIDSAMAGSLAVPNAHQNYEWTGDGLLKYTFELQNMTNRTVTFRYKTTFFDASGVTPVDEQGVRREILVPAESKSITVIAGNPTARKVRVQILN